MGAFTLYYYYVYLKYTIGNFVILIVSLRGHVLTGCCLCKYFVLGDSTLSPKLILNQWSSTLKVSF